MKRQEINIRDPYILVHNKTYYLYGTRSQTTWSDADGFDCYVSQNLTDWEGPIEVFKRTNDFFCHPKFLGSGSLCLSECVLHGNNSRS